MMRKRIRIVFVLLAVCVCFSFTGCNNSSKQIKRMQQVEEGVSEPTTVEEIREAIEKYDARIEDIVLATQQTGVWWKLLGTRYLDSQMYGQALDAFQKAVTFYPANQNLYYYIGVCAGYLAESALDYEATGDVSEHDRYLNLAESAYLRALEIEPRYVRALYGLSVIYVFEMNRSKDAIPYLKSLLTIEKKHVEAMFVLARAYYSTAQYQKASDLYDQILETTTDKTLKEDAERNKKVVLDALYN